MRCFTSIFANVAKSKSARGSTETGIFVCYEPQQWWHRTSNRGAVVILRNFFIVIAVLVFIVACLAVISQRFREHWEKFWNWLSSFAPDFTRQQQVALFSVIFSFLVVCANGLWLLNFRESVSEPMSQFAIAFIWLFYSIIQCLIPPEPEWEHIRAKRAKHDEDVCQKALDTLREERLDFEQIINRKGRYNSPQHKEAVEVKSFNLLSGAIEELKSLPKFKKRADLILQEIGKNQMLEIKNVDELIVQLNALEPTLVREIVRLKQISRGLI
jgi:hypothetical protein